MFESNSALDVRKTWLTFNFGWREEKVEEGSKHCSCMAG